MTEPGQVGIRLDRTTATEAATRALRELILSAGIPAGAPLRQDELARRLGVSRTPLREALQRLEAEGLVRLDLHKGAVVAKPSIAQVSEIFELQEMLESTAGRAAAARRAESDIAAMRELLAEHAAITEPTDWGRANVEFHTRLYGISGKPLLLEMIAMLRNRSGLYVHMLARSPAGRSRADSEHAEMVDALAAGDADGLEALIRQHLRTTLEWLRGVIDELVAFALGSGGYPRGTRAPNGSWCLPTPAAGLPVAVSFARLQSRRLRAASSR